MLCKANPYPIIAAAHCGSILLAEGHFVHSLPYARHGSIICPETRDGDRPTRKKGMGDSQLVRESATPNDAPHRRANHAMPKQTASKIQILVVDDHPVLRDGLRSIIESQGDLKVVAEAGTGKEAIQLFEEHVPDITLIDLGLPDINGIDVIKRLHARHPDSRIIVLTTYLGDVQALRALQAGATGYLLKATLRRDLLDTIRAVYAGQRHVQSEVASEIAQHAVDHALTEREIEVLKLIAKGCSNKIVADRLDITEDTVKGHVRNILEKLKANDRTHAVTIALHRGYFEI
jgi:DNA-binding NarL/FixJ family response regulator